MTAVDRTVPATARPAIWAAHATALWSFVFALFHLYWALGGTFGLGDGENIDMSSSPGFLAYDLVVTGMCLWGTVVPPALLLPVWRERTLGAVGRVAAATRVRTAWRTGAPLWTVTASAWIAAVLLVVRWGLGMLPQSMTGQTNEKVFGVAQPSAYTIWSMRVVEGYFLLGGLLFALVLVQYYRKSRERV
ncbi:hypothetical protein [Kitasatospora sp. NPDC093102]|uniref:hypothetical protein n=1 Tax=Kitasatospora sp. NPDC093102 TaxID=3155069 RepID=UPI003432DE0C